MGGASARKFSFIRGNVRGKIWIVIIPCYLLVYLNAHGQDGFLTGQPKIAYWKVAGGGPGVVIALPGGPCASHTYLRPEFDLLTKSSTVVYYDQRGCGLSQADTNYSWQEHVKDLKRLKEKVSPKNKVSLIGSSWGSALAMIFLVLYHPDSFVKARN